MLLKRFAHPLWRRLHPYKRQVMFDQLQRLGVSLADPQYSSVREPIVVAGYLSAATGLGQSARLAIRALRQGGFDVSGFDFTEQLMHQSSFEFDGGDIPVDVGTLIVFAMPPASSLILKAISRDVRFDHACRVGAFVTELERAPDYWRAQVPLFHHFVAPSDFACQALTETLGVRVFKLIHPVGLDVELVDRSVALSQSDIDDVPMTHKLRIGFMLDCGTGVARKNPQGALDAVRAVIDRGYGSRLHVSVRIAREREAPDVVRTLREGLSCAGVAYDFENAETALDLTAWYRGLDVYLSLHRGEGFGLTIAEAMLQETAVIVTDWSAPQEYVDTSVGYPVDYTLRSIAFEEGPLYASTGCLWADPNLSEAQDAIIHALENPQDCRLRGVRARERMIQSFSAHVFLDAFRVLQAHSRQVDCLHG